MTKRLRTIVCEDSPGDYELLVRALTRAGYAVEGIRVDTPEAMRAALDTREADIVFSDWSMPQFSAPEALALVRGSGLDLPFIIVSGTVGEDIAVQALRNGAHDFLVKDRLARLGTAIERELREADVRRERNKMREQLMISDRLASIGLLAAGVAHEINNPLAATMANLELALGDLDQLGGGDPLVLEAIREELTDARAAAVRVRDIVSDLRMFARSNSDEVGPVDVHRVITSTLRMASHEVRHRAKVVLEFGVIPEVHASEARLGQVFLNLVVNAAQAIPEGRAPNNEIRIRTRCDGPWVRVEIEDTGPGIAPEVLRVLFTPFVTTKPNGEGTGLGLSICHRIVTELGGEITVETRPNAGTTFILRLPVSHTGAEPHDAVKPPVAVVGRRGRVLVVDDEPKIIVALERTLGRLHDVTGVDRAAEAIARIAAGERFDVILSDVMMPEITGIELYARLRDIAPDQADAIVFLTGGAFTRQAREFLELVPNRRLEKPFDPTELRALISELVG